MNIDLSEEEYRRLLEIMHIADWVLHSQRSDLPAETVEYRTLMQKIFALAGAFGAEDLVEFSASQDRYFLSADIEESDTVMTCIEDFEEDSFWAQLARHLSERDLRRETGVDGLSTLDRGDYWDRIEAIEEHYWEEFERHGIERFEIVENPWHEMPNMPTA